MDHVEIRQAGPGTYLDFASEKGTIDEDSWVASSCYTPFYILYHGMFLSIKNFWSGLHILKNKITLCCIQYEDIVI